VFNLTRQQQLVLCAVVGLLLVGWLVKSWRAAHASAPPPAPSAVVRSDG